MKTKAAVLHAPGDLRVEEVDLPELSEKDILIRVEACGVCPFDIRLYLGLSKLPLPKVLGHELAGVVVRVGEKVSRVRPGDHVVADPMVRDLTCPFCRRGEENLCMNAKWPVVGFTEYTIAPEENVYKISQASFFEAALAEPLAAVINSVERSKIRLGDDVVVIGDGPNGLLHLKMAYISGAARVIVTGLMEHRLERALRYGATEVVNVAKEDPIKVIKDIFGEHGADRVYITVGSKEALLQGLKMVRKGGTVIQFAGIYPEADVSISARFIHYSEAYLTGTTNSTREQFRRAVKLLDTMRIDVSDYVTHKYPLEKSEEALQTAKSLKGFKVMVVPTMKK